MNRNPTQIVQELYDAFGRRDLAKVFSLLSPDIEMVQSKEPYAQTFSELLQCGNTRCFRVFTFEVL